MKKAVAAPRQPAAGDGGPSGMPPAPGHSASGERGKRGDEGKKEAIRSPTPRGPSWGWRGVVSPLGVHQKKFSLSPIKRVSREGDKKGGNGNASKIIILPYRCEKTGKVTKSPPQLKFREENKKDLEELVEEEHAAADGVRRVGVWGCYSGAVYGAKYKWGGLRLSRLRFLKP
ncbi:hypothetical protein GOBAR_AA06916 [Gossypium barbadense]|uniref:Uncharacterized protein n=1 Tax=Gossypium barbadense TaxID=3634 RepID=A0A2P5YDQ8_GOSBA|nr:hypothetical protein GOBAR_AA06916 [Gossypium barbadense]